VWLPDVCFLNQHPHQDLILQLYDIDCIMFGSFVQASGAIFPYYIDLRKIISNPQVFNQVLTAYEDILKNLIFDRLAGIPYGSLPTATGLALRLHCPMIFPRKEVKAHGTRRVIEGNFHPGETVVVVDDILISGKSVMEGAEKLKSAGLKVNDIVVFIDHEQGVKDKLQQNGYRGHAVLTLSEITNTLYQAGRINEEQFLAFSEG
jgi:uridine monophosphate synthetase